MATHLNAALSLCPDAPVESLTLGESQMLAIGRALLRNPQVLVAIRPMDVLTEGNKVLVGTLLRAWLKGGSRAVMKEILPKSTQDSDSAW